MRRAVLLSLALLLATGAAAQEMKAPHIEVEKPDWAQAALSLPTPADGPAGFAALNADAALQIPGIADSPIPVLLPLDVDGLRKAITADAGQAKTDAAAGRFIQGGFRASKFFLAGPAGYDSAFSLRTAEVPELSDIGFRDPAYVVFSGFHFVYELGGPTLPAGELVKDLQDAFPGIRRTLYESYVRYSFERYGVTYVAAIYCRDARPRPHLLSCRQADRIAVRFLRSLTLAGGTPSPEPAAIPPIPLDRPAPVSKDFTYFSPGALIPGTGFKKDLGGRGDYTVYARLRFPLAGAPAFANSQSFNNWGDCDFTGRSPRRLGRKGMSYSCKVNGLPLRYDESAGANYSYPWRDNFCEHRNFYVGQCPAGLGHQGQDIRPSFCKQFNEGADRCLAYQHDVAAVQNGMILREPKQEAVFVFVNTPDTHVRARYMHMSPNQLDADGVLSGRRLREGEVFGKVGNFNDGEHGTSYHLHFDMQVPTKTGWVFVNPYMTLVSAYEQLIGARGIEIKDGDPMPPIVSVPPVIQHLQPLRPVAEPAAAASATAIPLPIAAPRQESAAVSASPHKISKEVARTGKSKPHKHRVRYRRHEIYEE
ncbi:MAG TPA: M23 family peptidase [Pseudolabrys sp.]|nr:M23 family peptidase [Pseudolabrys sp.]